MIEKLSVKNKLSFRQMSFPSEKYTTIIFALLVILFEPSTERTGFFTNHIITLNHDTASSQAEHGHRQREIDFRLSRYSRGIRVL